MKYKLFVEKPYSRSGVYAWINVKDKKVYIGESIDMNSRFCDHLRCMYYKKNINALSNDSLIKAYKETDSPFFGVVLEYLFSQKTDKNFFLVNETIYMYEFSKIGFHLCNNISRDNTGYTRSFLKKQESYSDLLDWCSKKGIEKELTDIKIKTASIHVAEALERINRRDNFYHLTSNTDTAINKLCNEISKPYLKKTDLENLGIPPISKEEFIKRVNEGKFNKIAVCKFGNYLHQSAITILATKQYDIKHSALFIEADNKIRITERDKNTSGICFWAYGKSDTDSYRCFLSSDGTDKTARYLILPYTQSNIYGKSKNKDLSDTINYNFEEHEKIDDFYNRMKEYYECKKNRIANKRDSAEEISSFNESRYRMNDNFAFGYAWDRKNANNKKGSKYAYPIENMFPEIINKFTPRLNNKNNVAFLISEFEYLDAELNLSDFLSCFSSHITSYNEHNLLSDSIKGQNGIGCGTLEDKEKLKNSLHNADKEVKLLIAKL